MAIIKTDNPEIEKQLQKLEKLVEEGGGGTHSELVIHDRGGSLSIETKEPMAIGKEIIRLSRDILLPADQYEVTVKNGEFIVDFPKHSNLSTLQKKLTECMMALYSLTDKVSLHQELSFLLSIAPYPNLLELLGQGRFFGKRFNESSEKVKKGLEGEALNHFISDTFLKTRHLGYEDHIRASSVSILMPIVDFLNHHWSGATFNVGIGVRPGDLSVLAQQVVEGSLECYAFYGIMDAFDTLIRYDFVDTNAPIIRSIPMELEVPDIGLIRINSLQGALKQKKLGKEVADLSRFMPAMTLNKKEKTLSVTHLIIPVGSSPKALRRVLYLFLYNLIGEEPEKGLFMTWVREAERQIIEENKDYYEDILKMVKKLETEKGTSDGLERVGHLAETQLEKLSTYIFMDEFIDNVEEPISLESRKNGKESA